MSVGQTVWAHAASPRHSSANRVLRDVSIELLRGPHPRFARRERRRQEYVDQPVVGHASARQREILVDGRPIATLTPQEAQARHRGGAAGAQLSAHLSIAENIGLGASPRRGGVVDYGRLAAAVAEIGHEVGLRNRDPRSATTARPPANGRNRQGALASRAS